VYAGRKVAAPKLESSLGHARQRHEVAPLDQRIQRVGGDLEDGGRFVGSQDLVVVAWRRDHDRRRRRHDGRALPVLPLLAHDAQQMELRARQLVNKFGEFVEGKERGGGSQGTRMHHERVPSLRTPDATRPRLRMRATLRAHPGRPHATTAPPPPPPLRYIQT